MHQPITTLALTTGTSLLLNLRAVPENPPGYEEWVRGQPEGDRAALLEGRGALLEARRAALAGRWEDAGQALARLPGAPRVAGAEAASLAAARSDSRFAGLAAVVLVHSDTADGEGCARAVRAWAAERLGLLCDLARVPELQHERQSRFRVAGLRNLVSVLALEYRKAGRSGFAIDATGGYKGEVALTVVFGQAFGVPVFYRFEAFAAPLELPPLPVRLDLSVVAEHLDLLGEDTFSESFLRERIGELRESNPRFARARVLLEGPEGGSREERVWAVSPFGRLLHERWLAERDEGAPPLPAAEVQEPPSWGSHHRPPGVERFVQRLLADHPWIVAVRPRSARGLSHAADGARFRLATDGGRVPPIECVYVRDNHPALLTIRTTARNREEQEWALRQLIGGTRGSPRDGCSSR